MMDENLQRCANCPYSSNDRKIVYEIQLESGRRVGNKNPKLIAVSVKSALDTIFKFNFVSQQQQQQGGEGDNKNKKCDAIGVCEDCAELLTELYTSFQLFNGPRSFNSYVATNLRTVDSIMQTTTPVTTVPTNTNYTLTTTTTPAPNKRKIVQISCTTTTTPSSTSNDWNSHVDRHQHLKVKGRQEKNDEYSSRASIEELASTLCPKSPRVKLRRLRVKEIEAAVRKRSLVNMKTAAGKMIQNTNGIENTSDFIIMGSPYTVKQEVMEGAGLGRPAEDDDYFGGGGQPANDEDRRFETAYLDPFSVLVVKSEPGTEGNVDEVEQQVEKEEKEKEWVAKILGGQQEGRRGGKKSSVVILDTRKCPVSKCASQDKVYDIPKDFYLHLCTHISTSNHKKPTSSKLRFSQNGFLKCPVCSTKMGNSSLYSHLRRHSGYMPFHCKIPGCQKAFPSAAAVLIHSKTNHDVLRGAVLKKKKSCSGDKGGEFKLKRKLGHRRRPGEPKPKVSFNCGNCGRECKSKGALIGHIRRKHTNDRPFSCSLCQRSFISQTDLDKHQTTLRHQRLLSFQDGGGQLSIPDSVVATSNGDDNRSSNNGDGEDEEMDQTNHVDRAQGTKESKIVDATNDDDKDRRVPVLKISSSLFSKKKSSVAVPSIKISATTKTSAHPTPTGLPALDVQDKLNRGKKKCCPVCRKHMVNLHLHMVLAHKMPSKKLKESTFQCKICEKFYTTATGLEIHKQNVHSTQLFDCELCHKQFSSVQKLRTHVRRVHLYVEEREQSSSPQRERGFTKVKVTRVKKEAMGTVEHYEAESFSVGSPEPADWLPDEEETGVGFEDDPLSMNDE